MSFANTSNNHTGSNAVLNSFNSQAFSLVELSIVLVILGLLVGGVLAGKDLIRASELRNVSTDMQAYVVAARMFEQKYFAIPGDMATATKFWKEDAANCDTPAEDGDPGVCDGNGNRVLNFISSSQNNKPGEYYQFWRHLAFADLIPGSYSGLSGPNSGYDAEIGVNVPSSKISGAGWYAANIDNSGNSSPPQLRINHGNYLMFGTESANGATERPVLTPAEAWSIDKKLDDGKPAKGKIVARQWNDECAAAVNGSHANNNFESEYRLQSDDLECTLRFINVFE